LDNCSSAADSYTPVLDKVVDGPLSDDRAGHQGLSPINAGRNPPIFERSQARIAVTLITYVSRYEVLKSLFFHRQ
ncbi:MAG TPA: hypothetical protein VGO18_24585, partial [Steroidobacteraceae bacterium]|nr:hypothetical protein [Steroidobacteraceae bacterium]